MWGGDDDIKAKSFDILDGSTTDYRTLLPQKIRTLSKSEWQEIDKTFPGAGSSYTSKKEQSFWPTDQEFFLQHSSFWTLVHPIKEDSFLSPIQAKDSDSVYEFQAEIALDGIGGSEDQDDDQLLYRLIRVASNILLVAPINEESENKQSPLFELADLVHSTSSMTFNIDSTRTQSTEHDSSTRSQLSLFDMSDLVPSSTTSKTRSKGSQRSLFANTKFSDMDILINPYFFGGFSYYDNGKLVTGTVGTDNYSELVKQQEFVHYDVQLVSSESSVPNGPTTTVGLDEEHARTFLRLVNKEWQRHLKEIQWRYQFEQLSPPEDVDSLPWGKRTYASMVLLSLTLSNVLDIGSLPRKLKHRQLQNEAEAAALRAEGMTVVEYDAGVEVVGPPETSGVSFDEEDFFAPPPPPPPPPPSLPDGLLSLCNAAQIASFVKARHIPASGRSMVDKRSNTPGRAFLDDSDRTNIAAQRVTGQQTEAKELLLETLEKFAESKSFWTVLTKAAVGDRLPLVDTSEASSSWTQTTFVLRLQADAASSSPPKNSKLFHMIRIQPNVILAAPGKMDTALIDHCFETLRSGLLPDDSNFELVLNPYFFLGSNEDRTANVDRSLICSDGEEDGDVACMCERYSRCFLLCFHDLWKTTALKSSLDYNGIVDGYNTLAVSLMLRVYGDYEVREVDACTGVVGTYSIARTAGFTSAAERANFLRLSQIREMFYLSRCTHVGLRLHRDVPVDIVEKQCSVPWSTYRMMGDIPIFSIQTMTDAMSSYSVKVAVDKRDKRQIFANSKAKTTSVSLSRLSPGTALFFASVAREIGLLGTASVTPIRHVSLLYSFDPENEVREKDKEEEEDRTAAATLLLRELSDETRQLPGAALVPASGWGVRNLQLGKPAFEGHIVWIRDYSQKDAIVASLAIIGASLMAWWLKTAVFHFIIALVAVEYVGEEVCIAGNFHILVKGRGSVRRGIQQCGHMMKSESTALVVFTIALGLVEAASELLDTDLPNGFEFPLEAFYGVLAAGGVVSVGILAMTRHVWTHFEEISPAESHTYDGVNRRDGNVGCLLTGEVATGFRSADNANNVGLGPLQAQELDRSVYRGMGLHTTTTPPLMRVEKWVLCG